MEWADSRAVAVGALLELFRDSRHLAEIGSAGQLSRLICYGVLIEFASEDDLMRRFRIGVKRNRHWALMSAIALLLISMTLSIFPVPQINTGLIAACSAGLVLIARCDLDVIFPSPVVRPILLWVGSRSFAIYMAHNPCYWATREIFCRWFHTTKLDDHFAPALVMVAFTLIVVASEATYRFVETPLRDFGRRMANRYQERLQAAKLSQSVFGASSPRSAA